jgi:hypothetical protein
LAEDSPKGSGAFEFGLRDGFTDFSPSSDETHQAIHPIICAVRTKPNYPIL